jgi:branched-chain amino acid transport system permease protein
MMTLGLLLILCVLYLPGGLASLRWETFRAWWQDSKGWWMERRYEWSGEKARDKARARRHRYVG